MKKFSIAAAICVLTLLNTSLLYCQTKKGNWVTEGNIGDFSLYSKTYRPTPGSNVWSSDGRGFKINLNPGAGYFITDNFVAGIILDFSYGISSNIYYGDSGNKYSKYAMQRGNIGISPFSRIYFTRNSKNRFYGQLRGGVAFNFYNSQDYWFIDDGKNTSLYNKIGSGYKKYFAEGLLGFNHFFSEAFAFNSSIGYNYSKETGSYNHYVPFTSKAISKDWINNLVWNFGFSVFITGKKDKQGL